MCGILGIVSQTPIAGLQNSVLKASNTLNHRGPDGEGSYADEYCILVHKRLAIIDLEGGKQPMYNENGRYVLICNGEIYNYRELRRGLQAKGHQLKTKSDSEVIIHLYEDEGPECLHKLRGMFAFAIWDKKEQTLFCARDRLGIKPFHYTHLSDGTLIFASEIKAILATGLVEAELCPWALREYLFFKFTMGKRTFFKDIWTLEPGFRGKWKDGELILQRYWNHQYSIRDITFKKAQEEFEEVFENAVRLHLVSDVPLGLFLSGGLDTSANTLVASKYYSGMLQTYTCGTEGEKNGDLHYARIVAKQCKTKHQQVMHDAKKFGSFMKDCIWYLDEPGGGSTAIHGYYVSKRAAQDVTVLLSGEGADETLGGYFHYWLATYREASFRERLANYWRWWNRNRWSVFEQAPKELFCPPKLDALDSFLNRHYNFRLPWQKELLDESILQATNDFVPQEVVRPMLNGLKRLPVCLQLMSLDLRSYLYRILHIYDRMCMATKLENRVPFMDHKLVEFTMSLPPKILFNRFQTKAILRSFLKKGGFTKDIVERRKTGFTLPVDVWFKTGLRQSIEENLNSLKRRQLFSPQTIEKIWNIFLTNRIHRERIWQLISIEYWFQNFIDNKDFLKVQRA